MVKVMLKIYFTMMVLLSFLRLMFYRGIDIGSMDIPRDVIFKSFRIGLIFDNSITCYLLVGTMVFYGIYRSVGKIILSGLFRWLVYIYLFLTSGIIFLIGAMDIPYFKEFNFHMSASILDYWDHMEEITSTAFHMDGIPGYMVLGIGLWAIFMVISVRTIRSRGEEEFSGRDLILEPVKYLILITLCVFGARGGFSQGTLNWGRGIFSQYNYANQMSMNPTFTLGKSLDLYRKEHERGKAHFHYSLSSEEIKNNIREYIGDSTDKFISNKNYVLRDVDTGKPVKKMNVVMVLMESFMGANVGALHVPGQPDLTPNYDKLTKEGVFFRNAYSSGNRSNRGIVSTLTGFPSSYGKSIIKKTNGIKPFISLPSILKERGYSTAFIYGGDIEFDNMKGFLKLNGVDTIIGKDDFPESERTITWGVNDENMFKRAEKYADEAKEPFFMEMFTISNHAPFDIDPKYNYYSEKDGKYYERWNAFRYADHALGEFINSVKDKPWAKNTMFIFVADHGQNLGGNAEIDYRKFMNPILIYTPGGQLKAESVDRLGSQMDLLPTVMGILGGKYTSAAWGKDLLNSDNKNQFAYVVDGDLFGIIDKDNIYIDGTNFKGRIRNKYTNEIIDNKELMKEYHKKARTYLELNISQENSGNFGREL
ncbi:Phosphoglycerol transferase MdoB [Cetobacterium ceti]|uniref:Phosphoglycerol transferase MdoB n=1 Tax=Cetobacterium ceti TaxID=180163 RepID=A0A1T4LQN6_9FUSO|nr:alkaline phosphatase family protein [Cetobacterium ceti]SJZ57042.1 Phosphoglycerol transferase MdoB [Cetobacterium ceti]